jgi:hypothetical protein
MGCKGLFKSCFLGDIDNLQFEIAFLESLKKELKCRSKLSILTHLQIWKKIWLLMIISS